ncbi:MAG: hypothetical protein J7M19_09690 [Planctomycetes bacterium]|nr:hypothetical protein [Planctomycetota bacterium]
MAKFQLRIANADTNDLRDYDRLAAFVKKSGFHAMSCGALFELSEAQMADPLDSWVRFTAGAAGITKFVETALVNAVFSKSHIEKNAALLAEKSKILARHDLKGAFRALEPQWLPESFYEKHPEIRGPRVDHPGVARSHYYSPCIDRPEVLAHYREAVRKLFEIAPEMLVLNLWGNDSGAGICWCHGLYPGRNGPDFCRNIPMGKRIAKWFRAMLAGAKDAGGKLEITQNTHAFGRNDTYEILAALPRHTRLAVGTGPFPNEPFVCPESRDLIKASAEAKRPAIITLDPTMVYPLGPVARPPVVYFVFDAVREAAKSPAAAVAVGGIALGADGVSASAEAVVSALSRTPKTWADIERGVLRIAGGLVGRDLSTALASAWHDVDAACRIWPNNGDVNHHLYPFYSSLGDRWLVRPIVPAPERLTADEKAYYSVHRHGSRDPVFEDSFFISESVKNYHVDDFKWPLGAYNTMLSHMNRAVATLETALEAAGDTQEARRLKNQYYHVAALRAVWRNQRNVLQCGSIIEFVTGQRLSEFEEQAATYRRLFLEGMDDEVDNTREMIRLINESSEKLISTGKRESSFVLPENLVELFEKKIALMQAHRGDIDALFPGVGEDDFNPETYGDIDENLDAEGK